jgi:hypothetical protein
MANTVPRNEEERFPGQTFVGALEEYTKRIENTISDIEALSEGTLVRTFALTIFVMLFAAVVPLATRVAEELQSSFFYRDFLQLTMVSAILLILALAFFTVYTRLLRIRRQRRNLETLLWPYQKLLQKLSQIVDQGNLDEGTSTLIQLKILEAEVAYGRARRITESPRSRTSLSILFPRIFGFGFEISRRFEPWEARQLADEFLAPLEEVERLLRRHGDREKVRDILKVRRRNAQ